MTTDHRATEAFAVLQKITAAAGLPAAGAQPIRLAENDLWRLTDDTVVRISRPGQTTAARREVAVAQWLADLGVPAVRPLPMPQPVVVDDRAATFWELLPPHHPGTEADLATLLRRMHDLPTPDFEIGRLDPFVRLEERLRAATVVSDEDRTWLLDRLEHLRGEWQNLPADGRPEALIHGDAWKGNCVVTHSPDRQALLLDFERTSLGPPEWDLTSTAVAYETFGKLSRDEYQAYCDHYGHDVTTWAGYPTLRAIRELRLVTFALQTASHDPSAVKQAHHRLDCVRGRHGARPWGWRAVA
ncbi:aminoglycoside phosphotransferase family protein [Streptomyces sp. MJP52]|uniref:phosphotransferase family protein n=1 Tax=Streptomyces sp. MJP52 TaxID=2940555 RepID=UPI002473CC20|nr:aminoglycoside phosphotransferase family protein [Streptomyces sp. MJP52]MDH6223681.1 aminoglycoside phosphotransferase (APT) family kinase protein [Streptomyces sp. MJP52]